MQPKSEDDGAGMSAGLEAFWSAVNALSGYQQADEDGVMVLASRQAIEEVLLGIAGMEQRIAELEAENKRLREALEGVLPFAEIIITSTDSEHDRDHLRRARAALKETTMTPEEQLRMHNLRDLNRSLAQALAEAIQRLNYDVPGSWHDLLERATKESRR